MLSDFRHATLILLTGICCVTLYPRNAISCPACPIPGAESTDPYGDLSNSSVVIEYFEQTLYNSTFDPAGYEVEELPGTYEGTNSCWFPGSDEPQNPTISGGVWTVTSSDQWGPDEVGLSDKDAEQIWGAYTGGEISLPCQVVTYQDMEIECGLGWYYDYESNVPQTRTEDTSHALVVCRSSECSGEIPIY